MPRQVTSDDMSSEQAQAWIEQVGGVVFHNKRSDDVENAWVAVVRTPPSNGKTGKIILAFGESMEDATCAAEAQWDEIWGDLSSVH